MATSIRKPSFLLMVLCVGICVAPPPARAGVVFYTSLAAFQANSSTSTAVTFETFTPVNVDILIPPNPPITLGGVTFTPVNSLPLAANLLVATPGSAGAAQFGLPLVSTVLTSSGNENIDMAFSTGPTAVGFDTYTNRFAPPVVSVYDTGGNLLAQYTLTQPPTSLGFLGIVSDVRIGRVNWLATSGGVQNTGIDNVRVGVAVPEPGSLVLLACVVAPAAAWLRRRKYPNEPVAVPARG